MLKMVKSHFIIWGEVKNLKFNKYYAFSFYFDGLPKMPISPRHLNLTLSTA